MHLWSGVVEERVLCTGVHVERRVLSEVTQRGVELGGSGGAEEVVVLGHVAPTPWVASKAAAALNGKSIGDASKKAAGEAAADGATPLSMNGYKVQQVKVAVRRAIDAASA